ncbi:OmpP1/FadL family transporter [Phascolarctobacterium succinatutens]|uniref:Outer membrane protein transport protein, Ompp1/FadL/TodX family n=1 Tax=Phascolarctobacterium succinatutens YIT 12067 TaxID=626939 RepID=E8LCA0_9FIRM|nr:outer membrane protein transport protein [Phascolarctobacterium succinatutens]EFY05526.1 outer membrane protein transport protein, Ompp1/FadL/TodX family [Phascolarctobacterium succinatutens YIT 12067]
MNKNFLALGLAAALLAPQVAGAEGFAINEWSAEGVAMGGARMFAEDDAANVAYNPASITKVKGEVMKSSYTYLSPHGNYKLYDGAGKEIEDGKNVVHAGWAVGSYYVKQINDKEWFGIGAFPRFAMVSEFERESMASSNAFFSKLNGVSVTPTYAHKFDKKWSAAVGAEINYVGLELQKNAYATPTMNVGSVQIEGESYALGWNAAANYAFDDKNEIGVVYRSRITHSLEADAKAYSPMPNFNVKANAYGVVTLPDSWDIGYNHKFDKKTRLELKATRTNWSTYDALNVYFDKPVFGKPNALSDKNWENGWRYAIGLEHNLSDKYTVMAGFAFDESSIPHDGGDFMVPTGLRRTYSIGARYNDKKQTVAVALGWMDVGTLDFAGHPEKGDAYSSAHAYDSFTKIASISYQRKF